MARTLPRKFKVKQKHFVTKNMLRVTLSQADDNPLSLDQAGGYVKLHFPRPNTLNEEIMAQLLSDTPQHRPLLRTYTIINQRYSPNEIDIDFVVHDTGPASQWAINCQAGDDMYIAGPGKKKLLNFDADWFLVAGDMTALPAITVNLALLPNDAKGYAVIEVLSEQDIQPIKVPTGFQLIWLVNPDTSNTSLLIDRVKSLPKLAGTPSVWSACEFDKIASLRHYFYQDLAVPKREVYASSYWKKGLNEDEHKIVKSAAA